MTADKPQSKLGHRLAVRHHLSQLLHDSQVTEELLEKAGWQEAKNSHVKREKDHNYVTFSQGNFLLIMDIGVARAMNNKTSITYGIIPKE